MFFVFHYIQWYFDTDCINTLKCKSMYFFHYTIVNNVILLTWMLVNLVYLEKKQPYYFLSCHLFAP